jgi:hypothetical protein
VFVHRELGQMARLLDEAGLRGRKRREFDIWRDAALELEAARVEHRRRRARLIVHAGTALIEARRYRAPPPGARVTLARPGRELFLDLLRAAAESGDGPLTAAVYARARALNPDWPDRNTIARAFGSWAAALDAAGLGSRCSYRARIPRPRGPAQAAVIRARRGRSAARTLDAVWALSRRLERAPTVHEFLAWRAAHESRLHALSTLYRIFPDGWASVLDRAGVAVHVEGDRQEEVSTD